MNNKLILLSFFALILTSCKKDSKKKDVPKQYPVVNVQTKDVTIYQTFPASIEGIVNNDVRAKIQGYITKVMVDEGGYVEKGQPLFRLETNVLTENADAAKSGISVANANVSATSAAVNAAKVEVDKLLPLVEKNIISNIQLQTARANLAKAQAQLAQAIAAQQQASANYKSAQANVDYSVVRAPISGVVGRIPFKVGSLVGPADVSPLTTISDVSSVYAYFSMNEKEYFNFLEKSYGATVPEKIRNLPMVDLQLANGSLYPEKGKIETVTGQINPSTGTVQFRVGFSNPQKLLSNGNSGIIKIPKVYEKALVVPESGTFEQQGVVYVYKVLKDSVKNNVIHVLDRVDNMAIVKSGLNNGDIIVAAGLGGIKNGDKIKQKPVKLDSLIQSLTPIN